MNRKAIIGLVAACALAFSAFAAQGSAYANTGFTCGEAQGNKDFGGIHCEPGTKVPNGTGKFGHVAITTATSMTFTGALTKVKSTQSGVTLELQSTEATGAGTMENKEEGGVMFIHGTGVITYNNVTVTAPAGLGCKVSGGKVVTKELTMTSKGLTEELKFAPLAGETSAFSVFTVEGCSIPALNHAYTTKGSVKGQTDGATVKLSHVSSTGQGTYTMQGQLAGIDGFLTLQGPNGNGIAPT